MVSSFLFLVQFPVCFSMWSGPFTSMQQMKSRCHYKFIAFQAKRQTSNSVSTLYTYSKYFQPQIRMLSKPPSGKIVWPNWIRSWPSFYAARQIININIFKKWVLPCANRDQRSHICKIFSYTQAINLLHTLIALWLFCQINR